MKAVAQFQSALNVAWEKRTYRSNGSILLTLFVLCVLIWNVHAGCGGSCGACARRYGCMTPAWGKCCTQFFMHNGRKRSSPSQPDNNVIESIIEYIRLKSKVINDRNLIELGDNISESELDDVIRDIPLDDDVRNSIDDAIAYGSLQDELTNTMGEYKHRR